MSYAEKLKDPRWQRRRLEIFERDGWTCVRCLDTGNTLTVHHRDYTTAEPWDEPAENLETLCEPCHKREHENHGNLFTLRRIIARAHAHCEWDKVWEFAHYSANDNGMGGV